MRSRVKTVTFYVAVGVFVLLALSGPKLATPPWFYSALLPTLVIPLVGVPLMVVAFVMISCQGGWKHFNEQDPKEKWTLSRRLLVGGAGLNTLWAIIVLLLSFIAVGIAWLK